MTFQPWPNVQMEHNASAGSCPQESIPLPLLLAPRAQKVNRVAVSLQHLRALHMLETEATKDLKIGHHTSADAAALSF